METETIDKLFLELSQFTTAKTRRELELEHLVQFLVDCLNRQRESHHSLAVLLDHPKNITDGGFQSALSQCRKMVDEAAGTLALAAKRKQE